MVVEDADVDTEIEALRDRFATVTPVERPAADGDLISVDLRASVNGEALDDATADDLSYRIGSGDLVDGIDEAVIGLSAGESATFTTKLVAGEHAGNDADVTVTVNSVKERELPDVDDDFAAEASQFDTVEEMRADLAERVRRTKNQAQGAQARDKVLEALLAATEVPVPEAVAKAEFDSREHDVIHALGHDEAALAAWLEEEGKTKEELDAELHRPPPSSAVKTQLLLDAMAEASGVGVSQEEFTERIIFNAQRFGVTPDEYFKRIQEQNQLGAVFAEVRRAKALADAVSRATVTDASGNVLDVAALFGFEPVADETRRRRGVRRSTMPTDGHRARARRGRRRHRIDDTDEDVDTVDAVADGRRRPTTPRTPTRPSPPPPELSRCWSRRQRTPARPAAQPGRRRDYCRRDAPRSRRSPGTADPPCRRCHQRQPGKQGEVSEQPPPPGRDRGGRPGDPPRGDARHPRHVVDRLGLRAPAARAHHPARLRGA